MRRRSLSALLLLAAALLSVVTLASTADAPSRIVAIGDVHGAYSQFLTILQQTKLVDTKGRWSGGHATLVQTGDLVDRGTHVRETLDLVMDLEKQAHKAGGAVIPLLGNHEAMNALGDVRDVTLQIYGTFLTSRSEEVRSEAFEDYMVFLSAHAGHVHSLLVPTDEAGVAKWADEYPLGYFEYRDAFGPSGKYGRWIRGLRAVAQVGDGLFVHGGLSPTLPFQNVAEVNTKVAAELKEFDGIWQSLSNKRVIWRYMKLGAALAHLEEELKQLEAQPKSADATVVGQIKKLLGFREWMTVSADGPLWYRGLTADTEPEFTAAFDALLTRFGARYMVVGHTPMPKNTITPWLGGRVLAIDTGMLSEVFKGRASALEIEGDRFTAVYSDGTSQVLDSPSRAPAKPADAW